MRRRVDKKNMRNSKMLKLGLNKVLDKDLLIGMFILC